MWKYRWLISRCIRRWYAFFRGPKQPTCSGWSRWDEWAGRHRVMMLYWLQNSWNSGVRWLPWPSRITGLLAPTVLWTVCWWKCFIHSSPCWSLVHPCGLMLILQLNERSSNQEVLISFAFKTTYGGRDQPCALTPWITVIHSVVSEPRAFGLCFLSEEVSTIDWAVWLIRKPVSSKL